MTLFLSKSVKLTLEVFLGYSYEMAYFHPDILIEAILIKKACIAKLKKGGEIGVKIGNLGYHLRGNQNLFPQHYLGTD